VYSIRLAPAAPRGPTGDRRGRHGRWRAAFWTVKFSATWVVHADLGSLPAPRPAGPFPLAMDVAACWPAPIPLLLPAAERGPARLSAAPRAVPLAAV